MPGREKDCFLGCASMDSSEEGNLMEQCWRGRKTRLHGKSIEKQEKFRQGNQSVMGIVAARCGVQSGETRFGERATRAKMTGKKTNDREQFERTEDTGGA